LLPCGQIYKGSGAHAPAGLGGAGSSEPAYDPRSGAFGLDQAVPWFRIGDKRTQQCPGRRGNLADRVIERLLVEFRGFGEPGKLPHELERGSTDLFVSSRRLEIEKRFDVSAHGPLQRLECTHPNHGRTSDTLDRFLSLRD